MPSCIARAVRPAGLAASLAVFLAACAPHGPAPAPAVVPASVQVYDVASGASLTAAQLQRRLQAADAVLLGELHDNPEHHRTRAALLQAAPTAVPVFEHFARAAAPLPRPSAGETREAWLDRTGFDREGWNWPLHAPLVDAAIAGPRPMHGTNLSREAVRDVVRKGAAAAPPALAALVAAAPLDSAARAGLDADLVAGHCGQLPASMIPGMRDAQVVRDAAMAEAMLAARREGQPWLLAGNGHVRRDLAVPRLLAVAAPRWRVTAVGFVERGADGGVPAPQTFAGRYDLIVVTGAPAARPDPCAGLRGRTTR